MDFAARFRAALTAAGACPSSPGALSADLGARVGLAAWDLEEREPVVLDPHRQVPAASTIKVLVLATALRAMARRHVRAETEYPLPDLAGRCGGTGVLAELGSVTRLSLRDLLTLMIVVSDNTATNVVIDLLGFEAITACAADLGCEGTEVRRHLMDHDAMLDGRDNVTTAMDQARILDRLALGRVVPDRPDLSQWALQVLERQQIRDRIPARLPLTASCWNKTGEQLGLRHDVGLIGQADTPRVVLAVLVDELTDHRSNIDYRGGPACEFIAALGEAAYRALGPSSPG